MLSPRAIRLFLKYFDSIDQALSTRLLRKRTWDEEALTFLFTELLDEEAQADHNLSYPHAVFVKDLSATDEPLSVRISLETHSYPKDIENLVTQSDIGLILTYQNQFHPRYSFSRGWLFQAKRLFKTNRGLTHSFTSDSRFQSIDNAQHARMTLLRNWAECDFIRYLLYCPRPASLDRTVREQLSSARSRILNTHIFDYALGLELRDDALSNNPTIAAGIFVSVLDPFPKSLLEVHTSLFSAVSPFSWFIVAHLTESAAMRRTRTFDDAMGSAWNPDKNENNPIIEALIRGNYELIQEDARLRELIGDREPGRILPAHTLTIDVVNGLERQG